MNRNMFALLTVVLASAISAVLVTPARAQFTLLKISTDKFTNSDSVHRTEVEPDFFSWGNTIVGTFHVARVPGSIGWGSADIGWSTSTGGGKDLDLRHPSRVVREPLMNHQAVSCPPSPAGR